MLFLLPCAVILAASMAAAAPPRKSAPKPKPAPLQGKAIKSVDMDLRLIIPDGWEPMPGSGLMTTKSKLSPVYHYVASADNVEIKGQITYYTPAQFYIESRDMTGIAEEN
jgi:hypothetical protein